MSDRLDEVREIIDEDEREGFKPLRNDVASGEIEGHEYSVTEAIGCGDTLVEFDGVTVRYEVRELVAAAYRDAIAEMEADDE